MRTFGTAIAVAGLIGLGLTTPAQAATQGAGCQSKWPGRDGNVRAWEHYDCGGSLLGVAVGNDANWGDAHGPFQTIAAESASAVMNSGFTGGRDVVAFYALPGFDTRWGYVCLSPYEAYADNLTDNRFTGGGAVVNDHIESHAWVRSSDCSAGSWLT